MRRLERWLHEHVFKVGWLVTKKQRTTTLLYYTFFLPGVFLHEFVRWLVAGMLNVRAERNIKVPDEQQIAELKLTFVRLQRNTSEFKTAVISIAPFLVGMALIGFISTNILNIPLAIETASQGGANSLVEAFQTFASAPDVWLWVYVVFTIANTMMPSWSSLRGWRVVLIAVVVVGAILVFLGVAQQVFFNALAEPLLTAGNAFVFTFLFVIGVDLLVTAVLGTIEAIIERITGDSATFQNGKLIAVTRKERIRLQEQERQRRERQEKAAAKRAPSGPPSIYSLPFPIPSAPDKDLSQTITVRKEEPPALQPSLNFGDKPHFGSSRTPPPVITAPAKEADAAETDQPTESKPPEAPRPAFSRPTPTPSVIPSSGARPAEETKDKEETGEAAASPAGTLKTDEASAAKPSQETGVVEEADPEPEAEKDAEEESAPNSSPSDTSEVDRA